MELEHFSHIHRLIYSENHDERVACCGCKKEISGPNYNCAKCSFFLHKRCAELPREIKHPLHSKHPLALFMASTYPSGQGVCDLCDKSLDNLVYNCSLCQFDLDIQCALQPCVTGTSAGNRGHQFIHLIRSIRVPFTCDACGVEGTQSPYLCTVCQVMVHKKCIDLPKTIRITEHAHVITHFYFLQESNELAQICGICHAQVDIDHGGYYCSDCGYGVHVNCALQHNIRVEDEADQDHNLNINALKDSSLESQVAMGEEEVETENKHFSHEHGLSIIDEVGGNKRCDGCMLPLSAPIYGCSQCDMFLHKECSELPTKKKHPLHQHSLNLLSKAQTVDGLFKCDACDQYCHGFCYHCDKCDFFIDVRCSVITENLKHHGHDHLLRLVKGQRSYGSYCSACYCGKFTYFDCTKCDFSLDFRCASLPSSVSHRFDENHPLTLDYNFVSGKDIEHYCAICEWIIDPGSHIFDCVPWFYGCRECDISIHPECVLGRYPYIKFGGAYLYDIHPHPLTLVQKPFVKVQRKKHYPPCDYCAEPFSVGENIGDPCQDLALQCSQCPFVIHRKSPCFTQNVQEKTANA
ncbi:hypothetical protein GH714_010929 [Hevea brasiliensis]|uniref:Phorbol-ester/DAG-type domain-containing protein n=1 Tax=Hevea brasiliensis TaxID=3981 RepID=A0A6A6KCS6_HEVBR|nr:hypothetical protein GH714_010929 [Hevea brasiliensis]